MLTQLSRYLFLILLLYLVPNKAVLEEVVRGKLYQSGETIKSSHFGISLTIPSGWQGIWPNSSEFFILESEKPPANVFVIIDTTSEAELKQLLGQSIPLDSSLVLLPNSKMKQQSGFWWVNYKVQNNSKLRGQIAAVNEKNQTTVALVGLASENDQIFLTSALNQLSESVEFNKVNQTVIRQSDDGQSWQNYLKGRYLIRLYTGSGYSEKEELWLCSNGSFHRSNNSGGYTTGVASGAFASQNQGQWQAQGKTSQTGLLLLSYGDGRTTSYNISFNGDKFYLNDSRWFRDQNTYCQ